jgi:WD40 repeat protein
MLAATSQGFLYRLRVSDFSQMLLAENHTEPVVHVNYMPKVSDKFITSSVDGTIRLWDANDYSVKARCVNQGASVAGVYPLCSLFTDEIILSGWSDGKIRAYRVDNNTLLWQIDNAHKNGVTAIALSHNSKFIVSGGMEGEVRVWEIRSKELISHLKEHTSKVTKVQIFADDIHLLTASRDKSILCWDLKNQKRISNQTLRMGGINCFAISPVDSNLFVSVGQDRKIT